MSPSCPEEVRRRVEQHERERGDAVLGHRPNHHRGERHNEKCQLTPLPQRRGLAHTGVRPLLRRSESVGEDATTYRTRVRATSATRSRPQGNGYRRPRRRWISSCVVVRAADRSGGRREWGMLMPARSTVDEMLVNPAAERRLATKLAGHGVGRGDVYRSPKPAGPPSAPWQLGLCSPSSLRQEAEAQSWPALGQCFSCSWLGGCRSPASRYGAMASGWERPSPQSRSPGKTSTTSRCCRWGDSHTSGTSSCGTAARSRPSVCPQTRGGPIAIGFGSSGRSTSSTGCSSRGGNPKANASTGSRAPLRPAILLGVSDGIDDRTRQGRPTAATPAVECVSIGDRLANAV